jgi:hypothetical protein
LIDVYKENYNYMAGNIEEALAEAIAEIKLKEYVEDATVSTIPPEDKPCNQVMYLLHVFHQVPQGDYTYSNKAVYINKTDFTYKWHYGGGEMESVSTPFRDLLESKKAALKTSLGVDWVEITQCDEITESGTAFCVKGTTGNLAETWILKVWKTGVDTVGFKIISKTTVA